VVFFIIMFNKNTQVYLDYASTSPVSEDVLNAMKPYFSEKYGNASSLHSIGQDSNLAIKHAREKVASILNCNAYEIIFTSSGTESDNLALKGIAEANNFKGHIIVSKIEHKAILETATYLEKRGLDITYINVDKKGHVNPKDVINAIRSDTFLVSIMYANNEIGTIQNISSIGNQVQKKGILMHTDAVQAPGLLDLNIEKLHVDMMSLSAHKFYGPKGVGALYVRPGIQIAPQILGGSQERGMRASTENVAGIVGFSEALCLADANREKEVCRLSELRDYLISEIQNQIPKAILTGDMKNRLPNNISFCFEAVEGESLVMRLSQRGFCVSSASACSSGNIGASHVLLACGIKKDVALGSLRVTLGKFTKKKDLERFVIALKASLNTNGFFQKIRT